MNVNGSFGAASAAYDFSDPQRYSFNNKNRFNAANSPDGDPISATSAQANGGEKAEGVNNGKEKNGESDVKRRFDSFECSTCKNRRYVDVSDDSGVSFQTPTRLSPAQAGVMVRAHENEHVSREQRKAKENGMKVVSQSVQIKTDICPECGKVYTSGGVTRTKTMTDTSKKYSVGMFDDTRASGKNLDAAA